MPTLTFTDVSKSYGANQVIKRFNASIPDNEFVVLLGPSGCGKSTMLRMIAGLTEITSGDLRFDDQVVNELTPKKRNIAFVFQSYALYPHMTVRANIGFPLVMDHFRWWHHVPVVGGFARRAILRRREVVERVNAVAEMLELTDYLDRRPRALSGGQRQRVAVGRSLIRDPAMFLLDEPLSNLDAKLRGQMRAEISALHDRVQKTFVYVTHDQVEAMTMGSMIIVLDRGEVQQCGTPHEIYHDPANTFVAQFIGSPAINLFPGAVTADHIAVAGVPLPGTASAARALADEGHTTVQVGIRPEKITVAPVASDDAVTRRAWVGSVENLGAETVVGFTFSPERAGGLVGAAASRALHYTRMPGEKTLAPGDDCVVDFAADHAILFDEDGQRIRERQPAR